MGLLIVGHYLEGEIGVCDKVQCGLWNISFGQSQIKIQEYVKLFSILDLIIKWLHIGFCSYSYNIRLQELDFVSSPQLFPHFTFVLASPLFRYQGFSIYLFLFFILFNSYKFKENGYGFVWERHNGNTCKYKDTCQKYEYMLGIWFSCLSLLTHSLR